MTSVSWISRSDITGLACPYCGLGLDPASPWVLDAQQAWGRIGVCIGEPVATLGLLLLAPTADENSAVVRRLWVGPDAIRRGYGRRLVQASAAGMLARDVHEIVACGSRAWTACDILPTDFLRAVGFTRALDYRAPAGVTRGLDGPPPQHAEESRPGRLYRLDLDQTVVEQPGLWATVSGWLNAIRPIRPEPAGFE